MIKTVQTKNGTVSDVEAFRLWLLESLCQSGVLLAYDENGKPIVSCPDETQPAGVNRGFGLLRDMSEVYGTPQPGQGLYDKNNKRIGQVQTEPTQTEPTAESLESKQPAGAPNKKNDKK